MKNLRVSTASRLFGSFVFIGLMAWGNPLVFAQPPAVQSEEVLEIVAQPSEVSPQSTDGGHEFLGLRLPGWSQIAEIAILIAVFLTGYSLMTAGKRGWGWVWVTVFVGIIMGVARCVLSMFLELTSDYGPPDWDED